MSKSAYSARPNRHISNARPTTSTRRHVTTKPRWRRTIRLTIARSPAAAHRSLGNCLRSAQRCFRDLAALGAAADIANSKTVQTTSGTAPSTGSADGRTGSPLLYGDIEGWLARAFGARPRA